MHKSEIRLVGGTVLAALVLFAAMVAAAVFTSSESRGSNDDPDGAGMGELRTIEVELGELYVEPSSIEVDHGEQVILRVTNRGAAPHDLLVGDTGTRLLDPGDSEEIVVGPFDTGLRAWCTVPGHREAGMEMEVVVGGQAPGGDVTGQDDFAVIDPDASPAEGWQPFDPRLQPAPGGVEHEITLEATEIVLEAAPGVTQELWTFNNQVPGPILRGKVGDIFTVTLVNNGRVGHSIDFHASKVAWDDEMRTIAPGESLVYQFEAKHSGIFMYHCGTAPTLHHIGNGMFGAIIIDPPGLPPVDHEFILVQSEYYLGPEGEPGNLGKMQQDAWDAVVFNGYHSQYLHAPIRVEPDERVRIWLLDAGPSENSSFHIVGTIFDTVYKEGAYRLQPGEMRGGAQALDLQPAQGGFVEMTFDEPGLYPIVTHKFSNVGKGALGLFQVGDVEVDPGEGGH